MELIYSAEPFNFFHPDIRKVIKDYIAKNTEFNQIYKYISTAIQNDKKDEFAMVRYNMSLEEFTYYFIWTLDSISKVMQITTLHPSHFLYIAHNLRQDLYFMHNMCSETDDFFEPALKGTISTVMHFVVNMMDQMGYCNSSFANALLDNDKSYDFYSIVVDYYHDISKVEATVKSILEGKLHYNLYQLNNIVQTETVKLRVIDTSYIDFSTIVDSITPANLQHIDIIKSFLSDVINESNVDNAFKIEAHKQLKEKVDQIKSTRLTADHINFYEKVDNVLINNKNNDK